MKPRLLPAVVESVVVPEWVSPSSLVDEDDCRLRMVARAVSDQSSVGRLPAGPDAEIGTLFHRILELATRQPDRDVAELFETEYAAAERKLSEDPGRAHFADLASTRSLLQWRNDRANLLDRARARGARSKGHRSLDAKGALQSGPEIPLISTELRLRGRADRVRRLGPGAYEIRDYKSGKVLDEDGELKGSVALQLQAYGLMALEAEPGARIRLIVDDGQEREIPFDADAIASSRERIAAIVSRIPPAGPRLAVELATPGNTCWQCDIRHLCPAYRAVAPEWWRHCPDGLERVPLDCWGVVTDVVAGGRGVNVRDDAGRRVRIDRLEPERIPKDAINGRIWFFGLRSSGRMRGFDGRLVHSTTFYENPRSFYDQRAWGLQVFIE